MESQILTKEKNPFLHREELKLEVKKESAPTYDEVKEFIGGSGELVVVKKINSGFGQNKFLVDVVVYDSIENKKKVEVIPQKIRKKIAAEEKAAEEARKKEEAEKKKAEEEAKKAAEEAAKAEEAPVAEEEKTEELAEEKTE